MLIRSAFLLGSGFIVAACGPRQLDVGAMSGGAQPFAAMSGVHLGMTARELAGVRPLARPQGYTGYVEGVAGYSVAYSIPGSSSDDQRVSPGARLASISATRTLAGPAEGMSAWRQVMGEASARLQARPACSRIATQSGVAGLEAEWRRPGSSFTVSLFETPPSAAQARTVTLALRVADRPSEVGGAGARTRAGCGEG